jgi:hypothetical protein
VKVRQQAQADQVSDQSDPSVSVLISAAVQQIDG